MPTLVAHQENVSIDRSGGLWHIKRMSPETQVKASGTSRKCLDRQKWRPVAHQENVSRDTSEGQWHIKKMSR